MFLAVFACLRDTLGRLQSMPCHRGWGRRDPALAAVFRSGARLPAGSPSLGPKGEGAGTQRFAVSHPVHSLSRSGGRTDPRGHVSTLRWATRRLSCFLAVDGAAASRRPWPSLGAGPGPCSFTGVGLFPVTKRRERPPDPPAGWGAGRGDRRLGPGPQPGSSGPPRPEGVRGRCPSGCLPDTVSADQIAAVGPARLEPTADLLGGGQ